MCVCVCVQYWEAQEYETACRLFISAGKLEEVKHKVLSLSDSHKEQLNGIALQFGKIGDYAFMKQVYLQNHNVQALMEVHIEVICIYVYMYSIMILDNMTVHRRMNVHIET